MIQIDISNVWGAIEFSDLMTIEKEISLAHTQLAQNAQAASWLTLPDKENTSEINRILETAEKIRSESQVLIVLGVGGSVLSSEAVLSMLHNAGNDCTYPDVIYAGNSFSTRQWNSLVNRIADKDFSVIWISRSGMTTETAVAARALRWIMERKYGTTSARQRMYAITDPNIGILRQMATEEGWQSFLLPSGIKGRFSALTAAGLLPMAAGGVDILSLRDGALDAKTSLDLRSYENPAWLYCSVRNLLYRHNKSTEVLAGFDPGFLAFGRWWQQLFSASEGRNRKGIIPCYAEYPADLHTLGQMIQQGPRSIFETILQFENTKCNTYVESDIRSLDGLDYLVGRSLSEIEDAACSGAVEAHVDSGVPVIRAQCSELNSYTLGELFYFFQLCCGISSYVSGVDPFGSSGTEQYRQNMYRILNRPGYKK